MVIQGLAKRDKPVKVKGFMCCMREQYLRNDIKCFSPLCSACKPQESGSEVVFLSNKATHYAIPCYDVINNYLEIFELPNIKGIIILQSIALRVLKEKGRRQYERLINFGRDNRRGSAVFLNEVCASTNVERSSSQTAQDWLTESTRIVGKYYYDHLKKAMPIICISEDLKVIKTMQERESGVEVLNLKTYLQKYWSDIDSVLDLYDSIHASLSLGIIEDSSKLYNNHLPRDVLGNGIKSGRFFRGILSVNKHHSSEEAFVILSRVYVKDCGDILVSGIKNRNRAVHGDEVVVEILPKNEWKSRCQSLISNSETSKNDAGDWNGIQSSQSIPSGKIVGILERRWRDYVATLVEEEENNSTSRMGNERILLVPYDYRIPKIRVVTKQADKLRNKRVIVRIDRWDTDSHYPNGHFVKTLGDIMDPETEIISLLVEHGISSSDFPQCMLAELPKSSKEKPWQVDECEVSKRLDLRKTHLVFSIDPKDCEDVDDAISVRHLTDERIELGVHIADVTYFLQPNSLTDLEAQCRSTSVYLPDRRYDMLPHILSGDICSLLGNVDRYAVSVLWELNSNYEVESVWYGRTVLRSRYKMFYEAAQAVLDGKSALEMQEDIPELKDLSSEELQHRFSELKITLEKLDDISTALRTKRLSAGGLELNNMSYTFEVVKNSVALVTGIKLKQELPIHRTVAECMIFANEWVAKKISEVYLQQALLRCHPSPHEANLKELQKLALSRNFKLHINSNKELADSLALAKDPKDPVVNQVLHILVTHSMNQAVYFSTGCFCPADFYHYGLGLERYTHFTSPIRRYADVLVHRQLLSALSDKDSSYLLKSTELKDATDYMNMKHKNAQDIEKASKELFQTFFFNYLASQSKMNSHCIADGVIYSLRTNGMLVYVPIYGIKGAVCLCNKDQKVAVVKDGVVWVDGLLKVSETHLEVKAADCIQKYCVFDHITVCIRVQETRAHQPKLILDLFKNEPYSNDVITITHQKLNMTERKTDYNRHTVKQEKWPELKPKEPENYYQFLQRLKAMSLSEKGFQAASQIRNAIPNFPKENVVHERN